MSTQAHVTEAVREKYGAAARRVLSGQGLPAACCETTGCCGGSAASSCDPISSNLYVNGESDELPASAILASLGCGNPTALAELRAGETVLDLGSGGGIDVLLSARRVGPTGRAFGLDMTDDMLELANRNAAESGVTNVKFLKGDIEDIPLPDNSIDVIISNCVINLSGDKPRVIAEAFRVLKPGGRFAVSDVVSRGNVPDAVRRDMTVWAGCVGGALDESEFVRLLSDQGFEDASVEPTRMYDDAEMRSLLGANADRVGPDVRFLSAFVRATKPLATQKTCCGAECCN